MLHLLGRHCILTVGLDVDCMELSSDKSFAIRSKERITQAAVCKRAHTTTIIVGVYYITSSILSATAEMMA